MCCSLELNGSYRRWRKDDHWLTCVWVLWFFSIDLLSGMFKCNISLYYNQYCDHMHGWNRNTVVWCGYFVPLSARMESEYCGVVILYISVHGWSQNTVVWLFCTSQCTDGVRILWCGYFVHLSARMESEYCGVVILYISVHGWSQNTVVWLFCTSQCTDGVRILWCGYFAHFSAKPDAFTWTSNSSISEGFLLRVFWCNRCLSLQNIK